MASVLSYLMIPLMLILWAILTRAVALEYRHLAERWTQRFTDYAFGISSLVATFFGGMCVGAVLHGFPPDPRGQPGSDLRRRRFPIHQPF